MLSQSLEPDYSAWKYPKKYLPGSLSFLDLTSLDLAFLAAGFAISTSESDEISSRDMCSV